MPNDSQHVNLALHNLDTSHYLLEKDEFSDWAACLAFYAALHIVDAVLFRKEGDSRRKHGGTHSLREDILKRTNKYTEIYRHYNKLQRAAYVARYLQEPRQRRVTLFNDYLSPKQVRDKVIKHWLWCVIKSAGNFLESTQAKSLRERFNELFKPAKESAK